MWRPSWQHSGQHAMGILTTQTEDDPPFLNRDFYRRLCLYGRRSGLTVFVFTPQGFDWPHLEVFGFTYDDAHGWVPGRFPLPALVYDRCFFTSKQQYAEYRLALRRLQEHRSVRLLGCGLKGKWDTEQLLRRDGRFDRYLPQTQVLRSMRTLAAWLQDRREAVLKPQGGSQGRGVLLVRREGADAPGSTENDAGASFSVRGRDARNRGLERRFAGEAALLRWLRRFVAQRSYLLQQYLLLQTRTGDAYDVRALVQKDGAGRWQLTGMAVRRGQGGSLTSNLHGGGTALPAEGFLAREFGPARAEELQRELTRLALQLPEALESRHGRLAELGIDFGVDTGGNIWILEVNSKPGRSIFTYVQDHHGRHEAIANPIRYARFLLTQLQPAVTERQRNINAR
ncbi:YheC/YheD family endospore coat-associated protein [Paenibacillus cremeus]|uniref:YheC/YheD family protein n=1 Tax=Paenibacillus cremeus TaxID=2163881 RepID=A0A559K5L2_9BACL|nr:YheC/YheD family protein [Paenibacillus cremeus]TVY07414.1 YheC/YheD family protein [Paenibacillus cremeus]